VILEILGDERYYTIVFAPLHLPTVTSHRALLSPPSLLHPSIPRYSRDIGLRVSPIRKLAVLWQSPCKFPLRPNIHPFASCLSSVACCWRCSAAPCLRPYLFFPSVFSFPFFSRVFFSRLAAVAASLWFAHPTKKSRYLGEHERNPANVILFPSRRLQPVALMRERATHINLRGMIRGTTLKEKIKGSKNYLLALKEDKLFCQLPIYIYTYIHSFIHSYIYTHTHT